MNKSKIISPEELQAKIDKLPRVSLGFFPTPLDDCPRLTEELGGPRIMMKRSSGIARRPNRDWL